MHLCSEHVVYILCCRQESRPGVPPSHHQRSPSPFLLDSFSLHSTHLSLSTSPASQSSYTVLTHHPVWLDCFSAHVYECVPVIEYVCFLCSRHQHRVAVCGVPFLYIVLFFSCWRFCYIKNLLTCIWTQTSVHPRCILSPSRDCWTLKINVNI